MSVSVVRGVARAARLLGLCAPLFLAGAAQALQVTPLSVETNAVNSGLTNQFTATNDGPDPIPVELSSVRITVDAEGKITEVPNSGNDLVILPQQAMLPPGQTQTFRVQYVGDPAITQSVSYFVALTQVPVKLPEGTSGVQMLYNFRVLANVAPLQGQEALTLEGTSVTQKDGKNYPVLTVRNSGNKHALMYNVAQTVIVQTDGSGAEIFNQTFAAARSLDLYGLGLVPPNAVRRFVLPVELPSASGKVSVRLGNAN